MSTSFLVAGNRPQCGSTPPCASNTSLSEDKQSALLHRSLFHDPYYVTSASGSYITLQSGRLILDGCGGSAVTIIGHGNQEVLQATLAQMRMVSYVHSGTYTTNASEDLARIILNNPHSTVQHELEKAYFVGSGSEANDAAMKLAKQYFFEQGQTERKYFVSRQQAYHGNTIGAMGISTRLDRKVPFDGITPTNVSSVSPAYAYQYKRKNESEAQFCERLIRELESEFLRIGVNKVIAFVAETVVGATSGCVPPPAGYFAGVRAVCDKYGILLILDEIMCGMGRTGSHFAFEQENVMPDLVTIGKGLGGGYAPIAGVLIRKKIIDILRENSSSFNHGQTYEAHPVSCAAALAVQRIVQRENLVQRCRDMGVILERLLHGGFADCKYVGDIRGRGLFWALEFVSDRKTKKPFEKSLQFGIKVQQTAFKRGVAFYPGVATVDGVNGDHILIAPPYTVSEDELRIIVQELRAAYDEEAQSINQVVP